jgi:predicted ATPase/DNA-binding CsgD family transcriptional regulator
MTTATMRLDDILFTACIDGRTAAIRVRGDEWRRSLASEHCTSFRFKHASGHLTARRESKKGSLYWYAYRRVGGRLRKAYLGKLEDITLERLIEVVTMLARREDARPAAPPPGARHAQASLTAPAWRDALIGRDRELMQVAALLARDDVGLVTLTGAGGSGKTRLALAVADDLVSHFADGICFVPLAQIANAALVESEVGQMLGVRESGGRSLAESLKDHLREKQLLLILDNFEQILPAAPLVKALLTACPRLKVLVTSRAVLHISGEHVVPVPPLSLPGRPFPPLEQLTQYGAVELFIARAREARSDFIITADEATAVAEICHRLDGLPLAIELAAARMRLLSPRSLLARLERRLPLLSGGPRDLPARQQTLRDTIGWSYDLLTPEEQVQFRRLAVFAGGGTLEAIEDISGGQAGEGHPTERPSHADVERPPSIALLNLVDSLLDKSLVRREELPTGEPRIVQLETIRDYALERLEASGEAATIRRRHAEYFLALAESAESRLRGPEQHVWLDRLEREHDNIRAALSWSQAPESPFVLGAGRASRPHIAPPELGMRLAGALQWFWYIRCYVSEGRRWLESLLAVTDAMPAEVRARGLVTLGRMMQAQGDLARSSELFDEAIALYRQGGEGSRLAFSIGARGQNAMLEAEYRRAETCFEESLALFEAQRDRWGVGWSLGNLGRVAQAQGEHERALDLLERSRAIKRQVGDPFALALALTWEGRPTFARGDHRRATALLDESLRLFREVGYPRGVGGATCYLAEIAKAQGDHGRAMSLYAESLEVQRVEGFRTGIAQCLEGLASVRVQNAMTALPAAPERREDLRLAARLIGAAEALRERIRVPVPPVDRNAYDVLLAVVRAHLGAGFDAAWHTGVAASLDDIIQEVLASAAATAVEARPPSPLAADVEAARLTPREREVAGLIAHGRSNLQIGAALHLSRRTVETHVTAILGKLELSSRTQLAVWAAEHGLRATGSDRLTGG